MKPRVLVFSTLLPFPGNRGDRNRLLRLLQTASTMADVRLVAIVRRWEPAVTETNALGPVELRTIDMSAQEVMAYGALSAATGRPYLITRFATPRVRRFVAQQLSDYRADVFFGYQASAFPFLPMAARQRRVIDLVDSPSRYASMARASGDLTWTARIGSAVQWRLAEHERRAVADCQAVLVNSELDRQYVETLVAGATPIMVLDNCVNRSFMEQPWRPDPSQPPGLLFVGNLAYPPNAAAVRQLVTEILPRVRARMPSAHLEICGARGEGLARDLGGQPGVRFLGFVDDLRPVYRRASVTLVPVPIAGGTPTKLLESLAIGVPSVVSRVSAEVTEVVHEREVLVADTSDEFAEAAIRLLADPDRSVTLSANGRRFIEARYVWENKRDIVATALGVDA
jgi:glycosyltransferase involved in cell wall biosynthesis